MINLILALLLATQQEPDRPQLLESGFHYNATHRAHLEVDTVSSSFGGLTDAVHVAMSDEMDDNRFLRLAKYGFSAWLDTIILTTAHEYGHVSALSRAGFNPRTTLYVDDEKFGSLNPASVAWGAINGRPSIFLTSKDWAYIESRLGPDKFHDYRTMVYASGLNQEQLFVARNVDRYLDGELSRLDSWIILWGNLSTVRYGPDGDLAAFDGLAGHTSLNQINNYSMVRFLSGSSIKAIVSVLEGAAGVNKGFVKPITLHSGDVTVFWPEFQSFLTISGPSIKTTIPVKFYGITVMPSVEAAHGAEGGLKITVPITAFLKINSAIYHSSEGNWIEGSAEVKLAKWLSLFAGYEYAHGHTFHHDVFGATLDNTEHSVITGVDVSFKF